LTVCDGGLNVQPLLLGVTTYCAGAKPLKEYAPLLAVSVLAVLPPDRAMVTPEEQAPEESLTVPANRNMVALTCKVTDTLIVAPETLVGVIAMLPV
jgi:hypothetical protein